MEHRKIKATAVILFCFCLLGCFDRRVIVTYNNEIPERERPQMTEQMTDKEKKQKVMEYAVQLESDIKTHNESVRKANTAAYKELGIKEQKDNAANQN